MVQDLTLTSRIRQNPDGGESKVPMELDGEMAKLDGITRSANLSTLEEFRQRKEEKQKKTKTLVSYQ